MVNTFLITSKFYTYFVCKIVEIRLIAMRNIHTVRETIEDDNVCKIWQYVNYDITVLKGREQRRVKTSTVSKTRKTPAPGVRGQAETRNTHVNSPSEEMSAGIEKPRRRHSEYLRKVSIFWSLSEVILSCAYAVTTTISFTFLRTRYNVTFNNDSRPLHQITKENWYNLTSQKSFDKYLSA